MNPRRAFLADVGMGFTGLAWGDAPSRRDRAHRSDRPDWLEATGRAASFRSQGQERHLVFMIGGTSHLESFDPKPALNQYAGKTIAETPFADTLKKKLTGNVRKLLQRTTPTAAHP